MGYEPYRMVRDKAAKLVAERMTKKAWKADRDKFMQFVVRHMIELPSPTKAMDNNIMIDEELYVNSGCRMVFPESLALLEMLWRAKMDVDMSDVDWSLLPLAFSIAWPSGEIDGVELRGCLVSVTTMNERQRALIKTVKKYADTTTPYGAELLRVVTTVNPERGDERGLYLTHLAPDGVVDDDAVYRCMIPEEDLKKCLTSQDGFEETMRSYSEIDRRRLEVMGFSLDRREGRIQYVMMRLVMRLLVYMQACPEMVQEGYPTRRGERSYRSAFSGNVMGKMIGVPSGLAREHASPSTHWRQWHFRSYPKKKNGTKRKGIVAVKGTIVNADVDPVTAQSEIR
jgi:hypothetical protein